MKLASSILLAAVVLAGCNNPGDPSSDLIRAKASRQTVEITNTSSERVYYFVAERGALALLDFSACTDPANTSCRFVEAGGTAKVTYSEIVGQGSAGGQAVVFHWMLIPTSPGKYDYDSIRELIVDLE